MRLINPERDPKKLCVYVGMTGLTPEERFTNHKAGVKCSTFVRRYGLRPGWIGLEPEQQAHAAHTTLIAEVSQCYVCLELPFLVSVKEFLVQSEKRSCRVLQHFGDGVAGLCVGSAFDEQSEDNRIGPENDLLKIKPTNIGPCMEHEFDDTGPSHRWLGVG